MYCLTSTRTEESKSEEDNEPCISRAPNTSEWARRMERATLEHFDNTLLFHGSKTGSIYQGSNEAGNVPLSLCSSNLAICGTHSVVK